MDGMLTLLVGSLAGLLHTGDDNVNEARLLALAGEVEGVIARGRA